MIRYDVMLEKLILTVTVVIDCCSQEAVTGIDTHTKVARDSNPPHLVDIDRFHLGLLVISNQNVKFIPKDIHFFTICLWRIEYGYYI